MKRTLLVICFFGLLQACAPWTQNPGTSSGRAMIRDRIDRIEIGMTHVQVENILGPPASVQEPVPGGKEELWSYDRETIAEHVLNMQQQFDVEWTTRPFNRGAHGPLLILTLTNGIVTGIEK